DAVLRACLLILKETLEREHKLFECIRDIEEGTIQLINLVQSFPDHAAIGFTLKTIDDAINRTPIPSTYAFQSTQISLQPLRDTHDISRWEALVLLWNMFCPPWYKNSRLVGLIDQLAKLSEANWSLLNSGKPPFHSHCCILMYIRAIYFEIVASLKISQDISIQCPDITWLTEKLKERITITESDKNGLIDVSPSAEDSFGIVGERMIAIVATMASFLQPGTRHQNQVLPPLWGSVSSEIGVLFRLKAYLQDHPQCDIMKWSLKPFNLLSQFTRSNFLLVMLRIVRMVKTSTSLEGRGTVVNTLKRLVSLVATTTACLTADRERLCHLLISNLLDLGYCPPFLPSSMGVPTGISRNPWISQLNDEIKAVQARFKQIPPPSIQRSADTLVQHAIFTELKAFEKQFLYSQHSNSTRLHQRFFLLRHRVDSLSQQAFSHIGQVLKRLQKLVQSNSFLSSHVVNAANEVEDLSIHIFSVAKELSERKVFSELLKKLRTLGIGTSPTYRLLLQLSNPAFLMSQPLLGLDSLPKVKLCGEDSDELLFALLNEMPNFASITVNIIPTYPMLIWSSWLYLLKAAYRSSLRSPCGTADPLST
ncbi:hypothetical protein VP01_4553g1, partial [Puccinia sorghi]